MPRPSIHASILENMREGVVSLDRSGRITTFNSSAEKIVDLARADVIGESFSKVFLEIEGSDEFVQAVLDAVYESAVVHQKKVSWPANGGTKVLSITTTFMRALAGGTKAPETGVVAVFSDITETEKLRDTVRTLEALRGERLVRAFRERGHVLARLDPLNFAKPFEHPELTPDYYGITSDELERPFSLLLGRSPVVRPLSKILDELKRIYCGPVGVQYMHIDDLDVQHWLQERLEDPSWEHPLPRERQVRILRKLMDAELFETFVDRNFRGSKRFSLEGAETLIPLLDQAIETAVEQGVKEVVMGMSHRGRLNVMVNLLDVPARELMKRFESLEGERQPERVGDVRFHLGVEAERSFASGAQAKLSLCFNPSHLEFVGPVVLGRARARQDSFGDGGEHSILPLIVHGDAAFAGQGIVQEQLNLSRLTGFRTGGTVHVILNNQIGFTTEPRQSRSTQYASDVARMLQIPIFHVNGEHPEAVNRVIRMALEFRQTWKRDVVVDMYCYRRHGHMEQDNPDLTQPLLYEEIRKRPPIHQTYTDNLMGLGQVTKEEAETIRRQAQELLEQELEEARTPPPQQDRNPLGEPQREVRIDQPPGREALMKLLDPLSHLPEGFSPHPKIESLLRRRRSLAIKGGRVDWCTAETLAYATLLRGGVPVRLTGQDCERGTFAHRHAVIHDLVTGDTYTPLASLEDGQAPFSIHNSPLTETAVLAFEFGFSLEPSSGLVIWEAQFGDFANVAQVVIDQFVVSSEAKWGQPNGLCLMLPHGLEGQGPEHSSARPERFLQLCSGHNMEVVAPTTASQIYHFLRTHALRADKRPAVILTPKRLMQLPASSSELDDLVKGRFEPILSAEGGGAERLLLCSGPIANDLEAENRRRGSRAAVVRIEQLYPWPKEKLQQILSQYTKLKTILWVQDEPENMGAWHWVRPQLQAILDGRPIRCTSRPESISPATGSLATHQREKQEILQQAFL